MGVCLGKARLCSTRTPAATDVEASRAFGSFWQETQKNVNIFRGKKTELLSRTALFAAEVRLSGNIPPS